MNNDYFKIIIYDFNAVNILKYVLVSSLEVIAKRFHTTSGQGLLEIQKSYNIDCGDYSYVITDPNSVQLFRYGLLPQFATEPQNIVTARAEGVKNKADDPNYSGSKAIFLQPEFRKPIFSQRCIVVADAFYQQSNDNQHYLVYLKNKCRPYGFAGIFDTWQDPKTNETITSYAIITTTANKMLQKVGVKRMPVILPFQYETNWLKSSLHLSEILKYLVPYPPEKMNAYPVSDLIQAEGVNDASLVQPIGDMLQEEDLSMPGTKRYHYHKTKPVSNTPWFRSAGLE